MVIEISELPLDFGEAGLRSKAFVLWCVCIHVYVTSSLKPCPGSAQTLQQAGGVWAVQFEAGWGSSCSAGAWFQHAGLGGLCYPSLQHSSGVYLLEKKNKKKLFLIKIFLENPSCVQQVEVYSSRKCILPLEGLTCRQLWTRGYCKWNMWKQGPIHKNNINILTC